MNDASKVGSSIHTQKASFIGGLKFVSLNVNSLRGKKLELVAFLDFHNPDIVAIQETKIDSSISTSELFPESCPYNVYRKDRNLHGGGVMLLVRRNVPHMPLIELENDSESVWIKVFTNKTSHYIASWYREPGGSCEDFQLFREQLDRIKTLQKGKKLPSVHILGDFNFRDITWPDRLNKNGTMLSQSEGQVLIDIMNDHGLEQMVHFPTREKNTLDLILTSLPGQFQDVHSIDKLSDHDIVAGTLKISIPRKKQTRRKVYLYNKGDFNSMREEALNFKNEKYFNGHSGSRSVQENFNLINSFISETVDKHIPSKTSRSVASVPWITPEIRRLIRRKNKTHAKAKKTGSSKLKSKFQELRQEIKTKVKKQHDSYVQNLVGDIKTNPRDFYRYTNSQRKDSQGIPPLKRRNGNGLAESEQDQAEEFNGQFTDVFTKSEHSQVPLIDKSTPPMEDIVVSSEGVTKLLKGLNPSKALGPDELHPRVLKELAEELGPVFADLFQQSIDKGEIPKEWSLANICPLYKKGDRALASNYRPVSLTCVPCKLLEHIVCSNIMKHLEKHSILSDRQHAFRKNHSCETQLVTVVNDWAKILDEGGQVDTFILDFEKAFDTPPHELLKCKLHGYGISGKTLLWIDSFLCYRQQRVVVNGIKSQWAPVLSGVPQGTVLGPLLFSLYINDIMADIDSEIRLFADDCVCYRQIYSKEDTLKLQKDIDRLGSWARRWGMRFQPVKCNMMQLTRKRIKKI
ncbi:MAG: reverse transcriptase family protein, partial [Candidatus Thiodiazotropha sp.]